MTAHAVQSSVMAVTSSSNPTSFSVAAGSLVLAILRNARNSIDTDSHAPNRRRRKNDKDDVNKKGSSTQRAFRRMPPTPPSEEYVRKNPLVQLYCAWLNLPQIFRFFVAGNLGNLGFFYLEKVIFQLLSSLLIASTDLYSVVLDAIEEYQDGLSFFTAYVVQIVTTHLLYAFLVYGMDTINTYEKYSKTLWGQFKVYGVGLFGATALNSFLIGRGGMDKTWAFWTTTATFAGVNYLLISRVVKNAVESSQPVEETPKMWGRQKPFAVRQKHKSSVSSIIKRVKRGGETMGNEDNLGPSFCESLYDGDDRRMHLAIPNCRQELSRFPERMGEDPASY